MTAPRQAPAGTGRLDGRAALQAAVVVLSIFGLALFNAGFFPRSWTIAAVCLLWIVALTVLLSRDAGLGRLDWIWLALLAAVVGWTALSISWSATADVSVLEVRRGLVYVAAPAVVLLLGGRGSALRVVTAVWGSIAVAVVYALARYLLAPSTSLDEFQGALLSRPLGYANAVGILAGIGTVLALGLVAHASGWTLRIAAAASVAPFAAALVLSGSRGSLVALAGGVAAMLALDTERPQLAAAACALAPAVLVVSILAARSRLVESAIAGAARGQAGQRLALWVVLAAGALALAPSAADRIGGRLGRLSGRARALLATVFVLAGALTLALIAPAWWDHFSAEGYRPSYWHVAWIEFKGHAFLGSGAGTFGDYWLRYGTPGAAGGALDAHNLYLETMAELGLAGLVLLVAALALPLAQAFRARSRPFVVVASGGYVALLAHAALDWDWELPAVTLAGLFCATAVVGGDRDGVQPLSAAQRGGVLLAALGLALFALLEQIR